MRTLSLLLLLLAGGCVVPWTEPSDPPEGAFFPHAEGYEAGTAHGAAALSGPIAVCMTCHLEDSVTAPKCSSCHAAFPHETGWNAGTVHGAGLTGEEADLSACLSCHDQPGLVATEEAACTSCHAAFPHPTGWAAAETHGVYALASGDPTAVCGSCHGADLDGGDVGVACTDCHTEWPHPDGWADPSAHGAAAGDRCFDCHGEAGNGGAAGVACARCHATYPHPEGWAGDHFTTADKVGEGVCLQCHDPGDGPDTMVARCATSCHGGAP